MFTVHGERCWLYGEPIGLLDMEVYHIIPESLEGRPELADLLQQLGMPAKINLNHLND